MNCEVTCADCQAILEFVPEIHSEGALTRRSDRPKVETMIEWIVEATYEERFPYRLWIVEEESVLLCLRTQERWPGPKGQIFCLRENPEESEVVGPDADAVVERERVASYRRIGRRLVLSLDRPQGKRCDFLFLTRDYKNRPGSYEQIFFRTEQAIRQHKNRGRRSSTELPPFPS